jgi:UDP-N-acetyl-D-galactosamine dehydrogenase
VVGASALVLGITFKENCPDVRNTKVIDIVKKLKEYHINVDVHDPWANAGEVMHEYGVMNLKELTAGKRYDAVVLAVAHEQFNYEMIKKACCERCVLFDVKSILDKEVVDGRL